MIINEGRPGKKLPTLTNPGVAGDLLSGKQLIGQDGNIITGTIPSKASTDISVSGRTVTVPAGYYPSQASKSIASATQATPSITVSSGGLITASATQSAGYVASGTKSATKQLTTQASKTVTPGRTQQTAVASGRYTTGTVYVAGDSDLIAANIKKGINIFGVAGTYEGDAGMEFEEIRVSCEPYVYTSLNRVTNIIASNGAIFSNFIDSPYDCAAVSFVIVNDTNNYPDRSTCEFDTLVQDDNEEVVYAGLNTITINPERKRLELNPDELGRGYYDPCFYCNVIFANDPKEPQYFI